MKKKTETKTKVYTQAALINQTLKAINKDRTRKTKYPKELILEILTTYESILIELLKQAAPDKTIITKLFNGIRLESAYIPDRTISMYGKPTKAEAKISVRARLSDYFSYHRINGKSMGNS